MKLIAVTIGALSALVIGLPSSRASTFNFGDVTTASPLATGATNDVTAPSSYAFTDYFTFSDTHEFKISFSFLTNFSVPGAIKSPTYALYSGVPGSGSLVDPITPVGGGNFYTGSYSSGALTPGSYFFQIAGNTAPTPSTVGTSVTLSVSSVPLPASLPMFGAALLGLGFVGFVASRKPRASSPALSIG
jgi:hypothetical protein